VPSWVLAPATLPLQLCHSRISQQIFRIGHRADPPSPWPLIPTPHPSLGLLRHEWRHQHHGLIAIMLDCLCMTIDERWLRRHGPA